MSVEMLFVNLHHLEYEENFNNILVAVSSLGIEYAVGPPPGRIYL